MPSTSEKQRRFFGAVMAAKKGKGGVGGKARKAAKGMSESQIKDFLHKADDPYMQGFIRKCAEAGVEPLALVKAAAVSDALREEWKRHGWGAQGNPATLAAFEAGRRARTEPTRIGAQLAANPLSTILSGGIIPGLYGAGRPGSETPGIGAIKGLAGAIGGIPAGILAGVGTGGLLGLGGGGILALLLKNPRIAAKLLPRLEREAQAFTSTTGRPVTPTHMAVGKSIATGMGVGGLAGGALGPGELTYQLLKSKGES